VKDLNTQTAVFEILHCVFLGGACPPGQGGGRAGKNGFAFLLSGYGNCLPHGLANYLRKKQAFICRYQKMSYLCSAFETKVTGV
jgi:hypothetical protein